MTEHPELKYTLCGKPFEHNDNNVFPPFYARRSDELWSNPYLEELRGKLKKSYRKEGVTPTCSGLDLLDVGTGSGITAIHWLKLMPSDIRSITLTDNSGAAIDCAFRNINEYFKDEETGKVEWEEATKVAINGKIIKIKGTITNLSDESIEIQLEKSDDDNVWPKSIPEKKFDYIVFNGPHLNKDKKELRKDLREKAKPNTLTKGMINGICDPGLQANKSFIKHLKQRLKPKGYALLTFSDYASNTCDSTSDPPTDPLEELLILARQSDLVATFLSVSEFCPNKELEILGEITEIPKRKIMLWKNVILRTTEPSQTKKVEIDTSKSTSEELEFNLHKTASGFLAAVSQIADIYCTKESVTKDLYDEMTQRMQAFYRMMCVQVGWSKGIESDLILSGFTLPKTTDFQSLICGRNHSQYLDKKPEDDRVVPGNFFNSDIHRLEIKDIGEAPNWYIDKNEAMNTASNNSFYGKTPNQTKNSTRLQVRYRIQLNNHLKEAINKEAISKEELPLIPNKSDNNDEATKETLKKTAQRFDKKYSSAGGEKHFSYCLLSRYSGSVGKNAIFFLFSSTEDLPFLPALRTFGRIANTAANNMQSSLAAYEAAKKAARAAVFARNFSHITGSHVISNPEFRHCLAGDILTRNLKRSLDEVYRNFLVAENNLFQLCLQGYYRPQELWRGGTRILAEVRDKIGTGDLLMENTRLFHEYLQGRFDFIARAIDDTKDQPEPVWFVADLLRGFLIQTAYLDNIVADVGIRLRNMEFRVEIEAQDSSKQETKFLSFKAEWKPTSTVVNQPSIREYEHAPIEVKWTYDRYSNANGDESHTIDKLDVMVGLPGGMVAAHAFYSLLENIIRNSAKYGTRNQQSQNAVDPYKLTIRLAIAGSPSSESPKEKPHYLIQIYDNYSLISEDKNQLSSEDAKQPWVVLQNKLEKSFVKDNSEPETEDLGMMEMQACAQLLCKSTEKNYPGERDGHVSFQDPRKKNYFNLWTSNQSNSLKYGNSSSLTYNLILNMPVLLGCLTDKESPRNSDGSRLVIWSNELKDFINQPPFIVIIDREWLNMDRASEINEIRDQLPYRLVVINSNDENDLNLPRNDFNLSRVEILTSKTYYTSIFLNVTNEDERILEAYRAWLLAWKRPPKKSESTGGPTDNARWHLWIGLERNKDQVQNAWKHVDEFFSKDDPLVRVMVKSYSRGEVGYTTKSVDDVYKASDQQADNKDDKQLEEGYWQAELGSKFDDKKALLFDNHGNCFPEAYRVEKATSLEDSTRFYQKLSGSISPDLFRLLSQPPKNRFNFCFFIYSLLEACLANVVVVDERLAWSLVEGGEDRPAYRFAEDLLEHQKAGVFPIFRFRHDGADDAVGHYNLVHKERLEKSLTDSRGDKDEISSLLNDEGIVFSLPQDSPLSGETNATSNPSKSQLSLITSKKKRSLQTSFLLNKDIKADVILIHEGAMDILKSQQGVEWKEAATSEDQDKDDQNEDYQKQLDALYDLAPMIIRTSGRGRKSKLLGEHLPFIEFGLVSSALLTARNKFSLVRGLLGSVGRPRNGG